MTRRAVLIFADALAAELARRRWSRRLAGLLSLPRFEGNWDVHVFSRAASGEANVHRQVGRDFGERLGNAVDRLAGLGYEQVVVLGRDCPDVSGDDVRGAFDALDGGSTLVLGPDFGGGCWLIGLDADRRGVLGGVRWQRGVDFDELRRRGGDAVTILAQRRDLDGWADLRQLGRFWREILARLLATPAGAACEVAARSSAVELRCRRLLQLPPPVA